MNSEKGDIVIYQAETGVTSLQVHLDHETVWLTQKQMSVLFDKGIRTVNEHIKNIFREGELDELSVIRKFRITADRDAAEERLAELTRVLHKQTYWIDAKKDDE